MELQKHNEIKCYNYFGDDKRRSTFLPLLT